LYIAIGSKDADIAALKEKISSLLKDTDLLMNAVSKVDVIRILTGVSLYPGYER
jgi:hypothetical protein